MAKKENEKLESWINLAYAIDMGEAKASDYPKDFQEWYAKRSGGNSEMKKRADIPDEQIKKKIRPVKK